MNRTDIIEAYITIRKENQSIPDDVLDFMKDAAIEKLEENKILEAGYQMAYPVQQAAYDMLQGKKVTEHGIAIEERAKEFYSHWVNDGWPKVLAVHQPPAMVPPYCQVGTLVSLNTSFLGQDIGTTCIVYEVTSEAQDVECVGIISQSGVNIGYFANEEIEHHLNFIKHTKLQYKFISAMRLQEDFSQGRFEQYFK